jgi:hypothetical protein
MRTKKKQKGLTEYWKTLILFSILLIITGMMMYMPLGRAKHIAGTRNTAFSK